MTRSVVTGGGVRLPYVEQGDSAGIPLVLVHAYADSLRFFDPLRAHLPQDLHVYAFTQRGHGDADRPEAGYRLEDFVADLGSFMDAVGVEAGLIAGQSSGAYVAQRFAVDHRDRTLGIALISSPHNFRDKPADVLDTLAVLTDPIDPEFVRRFIAGMSAKPLPTEYRETIVSESCKLPARLWTAVLEGLLEADVPTESGSIAVPALILWGERDEICPRAEQEALLAAIPDAELVVYPSTGHLLAAEQPARAAADLAAFARRLSS
jgi:non-heme chloroperoxidase